MARRDDLREFVRRDWALLAEVKRTFWLERRRRLSAAEAMRIGDDLRRQVRALRPDWPSPSARAADLAAHVRLAKILSRAAPARKR